MEKMVAATVAPLNNRFQFGEWTINTMKGTIMKSADAERLATELDIPQLPEMLFDGNRLEISHKNGFSINFNAVDALRGVNNKQDLMKVAIANEWQRLRAETDGIKEVVKPFDWTFTTNYKGTIKSVDQNLCKINKTNEIIDLNKLKVKEKIFFYEDIILYEDELADNGVASMSVKIRVMAGSFFILLRFFLRVDNVLVRMNDTRVFHEAGQNYLLREYSSKEQPISLLKNPFANPSELSEHLEIKEQLVEKIEFFDNVEASRPADQEER